MAEKASSHNKSCVLPFAWEKEFRLGCVESNGFALIYARKSCLQGADS